MLELGLASRYAHELTNRTLRAGGVNPEEYGFLSVVGVLQPVTRTKLARATGMRRTTLRDAIRPLIERGHVHEEQHPHDGRASLLTLTPAGQAIFDRGLPIFHTRARRDRRSARGPARRARAGGVGSPRRARAARNGGEIAQMTQMMMKSSPW